MTWYHLSFMLFGIEKKVEWMDWYIIINLLYYPFINWRVILSFSVYEIPLLLIHPMMEGLILVDPEGVEMPPLLLFSLLSLQPNNGLKLSFLLNSKHSLNPNNNIRGKCHVSHCFFTKCHLFKHLWYVSNLRPMFFQNLSLYLTKLLTVNCDRTC